MNAGAACFCPAMRYSTLSLALAGLLAACGPEQPQGEAAGDRPTASASPATRAGDGRVSEYTRLDNCKLEEHSPPDEGDFSSYVCPGLGDYGLELTEGDLRQNLLVRFGREAAHSLKLPEMATSGGFTRLGKIVEWRGRGKGAAFRPDALILRYFVVEDPDAPARETAYLLTVSLGKNPCVTGKLPPDRDQNAAARRIADGPMRCL